MQKIVLKNNTINYDFLNDVLDLYELYSDLNNIDENCKKISVNVALKPLVKVLEYGEKKTHPIDYSFRENKVISCMNNDKNIVVCFSGGKDSVSTAMKYKAEGWNVYLYHIRGINGVYTDEWQRAQAIAKYLELPLYIEEITLDGKNTYLEHCMKNQCVCSLAINYALSLGIKPIIAYGDFQADKINEGLFDRNYSDTQEMWKAYIEYINTFVPDFEIKIPWNNYTETLDCITDNMELTSMVQGCLAPQRFRNKLHVLNQDKYNVKLLPNRCGSCWKCCVEYVFLCDSGKIERNEAFYLHCMDIFANKWKEEKPFLPKPKTREELYKAYMLTDEMWNKSHFKNISYKKLK